MTTDLFVAGDVTHLAMAPISGGDRGGWLGVRNTSKGYHEVPGQVSRKKVNLSQVGLLDYLSILYFQACRLQGNNCW